MCLFLQENSVEHDSERIPNVGKSGATESAKKGQSKIGRAGTVDGDGERKYGAIKFEKVDGSVDDKKTEEDGLDTGDKNLDKNSDGTIKNEIYKVYSQEEKDVMGVMRPPKVIGIFDSMGNGIVYDKDCDVRLSYDQNGGVFLDTPSKVPFSWKWNNFETPPIEEEVYENPATDGLPPEFFAGRLKTADSKSSMNSKSLKVTQSSEVDELNEPSSGTRKSQKSETIDHVNVKPRKIVTQMKPVCLKLNKHLSLRVFDRRNINLKFLAGRRRVR
ncbi:uncharacterized protein LOC125501717 isoform X2 [Athalia rosae]|uniref:uncharacterized protein LOC125501717 isoform X2 n=1 Tax=Athalia rosae TaxID=37344 RepID=UPI0020348832|nr:uncharacterized protein LOC125501717 isoform X2 [Athalia rosae]